MLGKFCEQYCTYPQKFPRKEIYWKGIHRSYTKPPHGIGSQKLLENKEKKGYPQKGQAYYYYLLFF